MQRPGPRLKYGAGSNRIGPEKMNIAIFGWYHHRNAGDDRLQYCLTRWLDGHTLAFLPAGRVPPVHLLRTYDALLIGGGGLLMKSGGMFQDMARWVRQVGIPAALIGVSIEALPDELRRELRAFLDTEQCCFAWFRDQGSVEALGAHPKAFAAPDLTWLYPYPVMPEGEGVAVALRKRGGLPIETWREALATLARQFGPVRPWPLYFEGGGDGEFLGQVLPGIEMPDEFDLDPVKRGRSVVSSRFHGLLFGLQMGRPVLAAADTPKVRRFMAEHGLGEWCVPETEPERLVEAFFAFEADRPRLLKQVAEVRHRLTAEAAATAAEMRDRLLTAAAALPPPSRRLGNRVRGMLDFGSLF